MFGTTSAWKQLDPHTWEATDKLNGKVTSVETIQLAPDGQTLTIESKGKKANGDPFDDTTTYQRASGTRGILGKWKTKNLKVSAPDSMEFLPNGQDGLTWNLIESQGTCKAKFDGKDYPATGPQMPPGFTLALQKSEPRSFDLIVKNNGKPAYLSAFTASADGRTLIESGSAAGVDERYKYVYDRQ